MNNTICPACGCEMRRGAKPMTIVYEALDATVDMPGWYCKDCDESMHSGKDMRVSDKALKHLKAKQNKLLTPEEVKQIRKRLKLSQREAGRLIGGGPNAFQKYEAGDVLVSHAVNSALLLLDHDPAGLDILRARTDLAA